MAFDRNPIRFYSCGWEGRARASRQRKAWMPLRLQNKYQTDRGFTRVVASATRRWPVFLLTYFLMSVVFVIDVFLPLGLAMPVLYVAPLACLTLWSSPKDSWGVVFTAIICTALIVTALLLSPPRLRSLAVLNYVLTVGMVWVMAVLSVLRKRVEQERNVLRALLPICSYCKQIQTHDGSWQQIEAYVTAQTALNLTYGMCPHCAAQEYPAVFVETNKPLTLAY